MYLNEKLTELDIRMRFFLCSLIKDSISGLFPHCDVLPFGSSVNGVGKRGCDLDVVLRLYPEKVDVLWFSFIIFISMVDYCYLNPLCVKYDCMNSYLNFK